MSKIFGERWRDKSENPNIGETLDTSVDRSHKKKNVPKSSISLSIYLQITLLLGIVVLGTTSIAFGRPFEWIIDAQTKRSIIRINY